MPKQQLQEELLRVGLDERDAVAVPPAVAWRARADGCFAALFGAASGPGGCWGWHRVPPGEHPTSAPPNMEGLMNPLFGRRRRS